MPTKSKTHYAIIILAGIVSGIFFALSPDGLYTTTLFDRSIMGGGGFIAGAVLAISSLGLLTGNSIPE